MKEIKNILIYRIGNLGDIVCAMPAMTAVRRNFPNSWVGLLTNKEETGNPDAEEILKGNDFLDEIITYNTSQLRSTGYVQKLIKKIRSLRIDFLVYLSVSKSSRKRFARDWIFFQLAGCRRMVGFRFPVPLKAHKGNGAKIPVFPQETDRLMSLLSPLGIDIMKVDFRLPIKERDMEIIDSIWTQHNMKDRNPVVAICPGAKFPVKRWPNTHFSEVIAILHKQFNAHIVLFGGAGEKTAAKEIMERGGNPIVNLTGKTTYMQSAEVLRRCNLLVSNDCGPVHLAAAVDTPVVGIYSSRDVYGAWHPWGNKHTILRNDSVPCRFCLKTECSTMECINSITIEQVVRACQHYL